MLAIAHVLDGRSRAEAAELCGMDRQTLRDWVHRYNADGLACWERVICSGFVVRQMFVLFAGCSWGGTCGDKWLYGVFS